MSELRDLGVEMRTKVLGEDGFAANPPREDQFTAPFSKLLLEYCWGSIWGDDTIDHRTRSLINVALLAALNRPGQFKTHLKGALNNGCTQAEISAVLQQVAVYAGIPAGAEAFRLAREVLGDDLV